MKRMLSLQVSASAIAHNMRAIRDVLGPSVKLCAVVKSNAYGHGIELVWHTIAEHADCLAVASAYEAIELRELGYEGPLLMLFCVSACGTGTDAIKRLTQLIERNVILSVADPGDVELIRSAVARSCDSHAAVHVEIDSGMTRSGVSPKRFASLLDSISGASDLKLEGIYTHFATADEEDHSFLEQQYRMTHDIVNSCNINRYVCVHCANSAAAAFSAFRADMVRIGLMMYGYRPMPHIMADLDLRPAMRLLSTIMQVHEVAPGTGIGYGLTFTCARRSRIGLVAGGYGDGYPRALSNCGVVRIGNCVAPVVGRVSMDQITVDLTDVPGAGVGDTVELIASDMSAPNNADGLAEKAGTISYEILTGLNSHRMERMLIDG